MKTPFYCAQSTIPINKLLQECLKIINLDVADKNSKKIKENKYLREKESRR
jgi:hypothetical protein